MAFLILASLAWLLSAGMSLGILGNSSGDLGMSSPNYAKWLMYFCILSIILAVVFAGLSLGSSMSSMKNIMNLVSIASALVLVYLSTENDWGVLGLSCATLIAVLSAGEIIVDE